MGDYENTMLHLQGLASRCTTCTVISKELLETAAVAIKSLQARVNELENAQKDPLTEPHGDLVDRDVIIENLLLDPTTEIMARTKIVNEYMVLALESAPVLVPTNRKDKKDTRL